MAEDKPVAAFTLSFVGLALQVIGVLFFAYWMFGAWSTGFWWWRGMMMSPWMMVGYWPIGFGWLLLATALSVVVIGLGVAGVLWMKSAELSRVRTGSTLVLVASIIAFPTGFGFIIGSLLMFIGGILGLTWQPLATKAG